MASSPSAVQDIEVFAMEKGCAWDFSYSLKDLFKPHFNTGINTKTLKSMVEDKSMLSKVESHLAMSASPYDKNDLTVTTRNSINYNKTATRTRKKGGPYWMNSETMVSDNGGLSSKGNAL